MRDFPTVSILHNLLTANSFNQTVGEASSSISHWQSGRSRSSFGLNNFSTSFLNPLSHAFDLIFREIDTRLCLRHHRNYCDARMSANHWDVNFSWITSHRFSDESLGTNNIECGDAKDTFCIQHASFFQSFTSNWNGWVDRVWNDSDKGFWTCLGTTSYDIANNWGVGFEEVISWHSWFARNTSWDDHDVGIWKFLIQDLI